MRFLGSKLTVMALAASAVILTGCNSGPPAMTQTSTIGAMVAGSYDATMTCDELLSYGDYGVGALSKLDGEFTLVDGEFYVTNIEGKLIPVKPQDEVCFSTVVDFRPKAKVMINNPMTKEELNKYIDTVEQNPNIFYAVVIKGEFATITTRSLPPQKPPYQPLDEVIKRQVVHNMSNLKGTLVGFRFPAYAGKFNVAGYHYHFVSEEKTKGGHVKDFKIRKGVLEYAPYTRLQVFLPPDVEKLRKLDLRGDITKSVENFN
ncbi:acetolactate decarboxylase [Lentisphaerota bacterium ZTH]|nr:acetolactate decarboxylase [Lentisphaerota bacterium]WET07695.1 acetolactate decarboxylase [Lentisphaerota bacterium ZTH]